MCRARPSTVVVCRLATSSPADDGSTRCRLHVVTRPGRHRLDALEVDQHVDRADDQRQRSHHDKRQDGRRLEDRVPAAGRRGRR